MTETMTVAGLDVHARSTHGAAICVPTGELVRIRFGAGVDGPIQWLKSLPGPVRACYEAGPTGFGLYRAAVAAGVEMRVIAPGKTPRAPSDRVKTELFGTPRPDPAMPGTSLKRTVPAAGPLVTFATSRKMARIRVDQTVLELSEELGIGIEFSCRVGTCGICKVRMTSGEVAMAVEDALEPGEKIRGMILACQAKPASDVVVEA